MSFTTSPTVRRRKAALVSAIGLGLLLAGPLAIGSAAPKSKDSRRGFYLTQGGYNGAETATACAAGFHMASLWDIFDPSNLRYDTSRGFTEEDSGSGPPAFGGWIRSGLSVTEGTLNCVGWTVSDDSHMGSFVRLSRPGEWSSAPTQISPWRESLVACDSVQRVWCVQD